MQASIQQKILFPLLAFLLCLFFAPHAEAAPMYTENGTEIIALNYHKIDAVDHPLSVSPEEFEAQIAYLKDNNYTSITPDQIHDYLTKGVPLPRRPILITFDDGYEDNYEHAYPILKEYGFHATIFVIVNYMETPGYLTWEQAKEMSRNGISIQSHTVSHQPLSPLSKEDAASELSASRSSIEEHIGQPVRYLAYPEGSYNHIVEQLAEKAGYKGAFSIRCGIIDNASHPFRLERIPVFHTHQTFRDFLRRLHYASNFERFGWIHP